MNKRKQSQDEHARAPANDLRSPHSVDRFTAALSPADEAFRASEAKWGVARLERLVSAATLANYRRGWMMYRQAIVGCDPEGIERLAPKMVQALQAMDAEATAAGHQPLSVERWEAPLEGGRILVVVRMQAEAHAIAREPSDGREMVVYSIGELAKLLPLLDSVNIIKAHFPGAEAVNVSGVQMSEGQVADWVREDPLYEVIHG